MIRLEHVSLDLDGRKILDDVSFELKTGETKVVIGPSGAGKSSLLRIVLGLWKPQSGRVFFDNVDITDIPERKLNAFRRRAAMIFQGNALFDSLTVEENVGFFLKERAKIAPDALLARVNDCLEFVNLPDTNGLLPDELSGGMKKRVAIARAIAYEPDLILYDEPTTGLDPVNAKTVTELIMKLKQERHVTSIVVTHILRDAFVVGDALAMMKDGKIIFDGTPQELIASTDPFVENFISEVREESGLYINGESIFHATK